MRDLMVHSSEGTITQDVAGEGLNIIDQDENGFIDKSELENPSMCNALQKKWSFNTFLRFKKAIDFVDLEQKTSQCIDFQLEENEYVVPANVMQSFYLSFDSSLPFGGAAGVALKKDWLSNPEIKSRFVTNLQERGYSEVDINRYVDIFSPDENTLIIVDDSNLSNARKFLTHERFHLEMGKLSEDDYKLMMEVAKELKKVNLPHSEDEKRRLDLEFAKMKEKYGEEADEIKESLYAKKLLPDNAINGNLEEFFAYSATEKRHGDLIEPYIQATSGKAYEIYSKIKKRVLDTEHYRKDSPSVAN